MCYVHLVLCLAASSLWSRLYHPPACPPPLYCICPHRALACLCVCPAADAVTGFDNSRSGLGGGPPISSPPAASNDSSSSTATTTTAAATARSRAASSTSSSLPAPLASPSSKSGSSSSRDSISCTSKTIESRGNLSVADSWAESAPLTLDFTPLGRGQCVGYTISAEALAATACADKSPEK